jgi:type VI protein secretion system component VasK
MLEYFGLSPKMLFIIVVGLVVAIGAWWLVKLIYKHREKAKELTLVRRMFASTSGGSTAGRDPAQRARIDDIRRSFKEGVERFRDAGKSVYTLPWVLLAGPSGSGKTEAIRHSNVGFPPGLQNYLQGVGGTVNMHWWFTNDAVILDTAGRVLMESADQGGNDEWRELLKMLKDVRPLCPINGLLLCIGADRLIKDSGDDIQETAGKIAQQLDTIQRVLDVRFPVFVVVTKCDLITGFREFFESVTDPALQHQMMGWSNPAALDTVFNPEQVSEHIESVRQRLLRRRYALTIDPIHTDDPQARRTDQVDALYALPDSLARLSSRLRRYLEPIFVQGEWSPKPLFLRGIYFTSSMQQGAELDEELAKMLGVGVDELSGGVSEEKSYFLRDVFKKKVFKEMGLVTRATNILKRRVLADRGKSVPETVLDAAATLLAATLIYLSLR